MPYFAGIDLGSTGIKVLLTDEVGAVRMVRQRPTPWRYGARGATTLRAEDLLSTAQALLREVDELLRRGAGTVGRQVEAIAISGMGETGFVTEPDRRALAPAFAWFDVSGAAQVEALPPHLREEFGGRTGLPWGVQVSAAKLLHLRDGGLRLEGSRWSNLPEFLAAALGGHQVGDRSLTSRTGLIDQGTGEPWPELLSYIGLDGNFLPPVVEAGTPLGAVRAPWAPAAFTGAAITVAGHDHLVAALAGGAAPGDRYYVSMGTAEVILRIIDSPLSFDARSRLADRLINTVPHVVPGQFALVAGIKSGLLMRRALQLFGVDGDMERDRLDAEACKALDAASVPDGAVEVYGARNDDGVLALTVRADGVSPAEAFRAILEHSNAELASLLTTMETEVSPARSTLLTGGWAGMRAVRKARGHVYPSPKVSERSQDTAYGAARLATELNQASLTRTSPSPSAPHQSEHLP